VRIDLKHRITIQIQAALAESYEGHSERLSIAKNIRVVAFWEGSCA
jgi:hypothetical protein